MILPVVLCGGSGTRLWPLSRKSSPKQFVPLFGNTSLLGSTLRRVSEISSAVLCVTLEEYRFTVAGEMLQAGVKGNLLLEPFGKNTAASAALASLMVPTHERTGTLLLFCPSDHHVPNIDGFCEMVSKGIPMAKDGAIVLFGVEPTYPATGYGYVQSEGVLVRRFIEKPSRLRAEEMISEGGHYWNSGIFLCRADVLVSELMEYAPSVIRGCLNAVGSAQSESLDGYAFVRPEPEAFSRVNSVSIDYAVMEKTSKLRLVPFEGSWSDVGNWATVSELYPSDESANRLFGDSIAIETKNTFIYSPHRPIVALGVSDLLIVDTPDALLVAQKDSAEDVKRVVEILKERGSIQAVYHRRVNRPWGWYDLVDAGERFQVKRISVRPGAGLSLQLHHHRAEHWVVVRGTARVTREEESFFVKENESVFIPLGAKHRLENPGNSDLEIIEVQSGSYLGEDDIVRFEDKYRRN